MQRWEKDEEWSEQLIQQFEPVLHRVLRDYHVSVQKVEYQDLVQMGRIKILEAYQQLGGNPFAIPDRYRYVAYIRRGFQWCCLREFSIQNRCQSLEGITEEVWEVLGAEESAFHEMEFEEEFTQFLATLSPRQRLTLELLFLYEPKISQLAQIEQRNVSKYYRDLTKIRCRYQAFMEKQNSRSKSDS